MGNYTPAGRRTRSVYDTLAEAEDDHFLDCPNADVWIRAGAILLDGILFFLINSGILRIAGMVVTYLLRSPDSVADEAEMRLTVNYCILVARMLLFYFYMIWTVSQFGGTPAKLLLGLRVMDINSGQKLTIPIALWREFIGKTIGVLTLGVGFGLAYYRPDSRALHDLISRSVVKRVRGGG